jgi:hypothetical protein
MTAKVARSTIFGILATKFYHWVMLPNWRLRMRMLAAFMALLLALTSFATGISASDVTVKMTNPDFERGLDTWEQFTFPQQNKNVKFEVEANGRNSTKSAKVTSGGRGGGSLVQNIQIEQWSQVHVKGYVKTESLRGSAGIECVSVSNNPPRPPLPKCMPDMQGTQDWTLVEGDFNIELGARSLRISLTVMGEGTAYFDDVSITATPGSPAPPNFDIDKNLMPDGGFEVVENGSFKHWSKKEGTGKLTVSTEANEGKYCARLENDIDKPLIIATSFDVEEGEMPFGIKGMIKTKAGQKAHIAIQMQPKSGGGRAGGKQMEIGITTPDTSEDGQWTPVRSVFKLPPETKTITVVCSADTAGTAFFDSIELGLLKRPDQGEDKTGKYQEHWVENPVSKVKLCVHEFQPDRFDPNKQYPAIIMLPGGNGWGTQLERGGLPSKLAKSLESVVFVFDPDGRGLTKEGTDDISGTIHQAGLNAVSKFIVSQPHVDPSNFGYYTMSFGIIIGACTAGRYVNDPPIKFILDWEGPDGHLCPVNHVGKYDMDFWGEREALDFIKKYPGIYIRMQTEKDHAQKTNDHALRMINAATAKAYGGQGKTVFSRVNMRDGVYSNPPNKTYSGDTKPVWFPEDQDKMMDQHTLTVLRELIGMDVNPESTQKKTKTTVSGRNRLGFSNPFTYPKSSLEATKSYFRSLGVKDDKEFIIKIASEMAPLNPNVCRINIPVDQDESWKQRFSGIDVTSWQETRFIGTLIFRTPGDSIEYARKVSEIVEFYDGDGDADNLFGLTIKDWQIENEVNQKNLYWTGTPAQYASHLENCAKAARNADPDCNIILAGEACDNGNDYFPKVLEALDKKQVFDAVDIHVYTDPSDRMAVEKMAKRFRGYLQSAGFNPDIPLWMTEFGVPSGNLKNGQNMTEDQQAAIFAIRTIQAAAMGFEGFCYHSLVDSYPDQLSKGYYSQMGLESSGLSTKEKAWSKRKAYWTYLMLSEMFSTVSFEGVSDSSVFGETIKTYKFSRPGQDPLIFAFIDNPQAKPQEKPNLFSQPFTCYPLVGRFEGFTTENLSGMTVMPGDRDKIAKFLGDLATGPVAIVMGNSSSINSRFGVCDTITQACLDGTSCSPFYTPQMLADSGTSWMMFRPKLDFMKNTQSWTANDKIVADMRDKGIEPIADISAYPGLDLTRFSEAASQIAERYDSDGLADIFGSQAVTRFRMIPDPKQSAQDFAQMAIAAAKSLKSANRNAQLIIGGDKPVSWWSEVFVAIKQSTSGKERKIVDIFDLPPFSSVASDKEHNHKAFLGMINEYTKALSSSGLPNVKIATMQLSTYSGTIDDKPEQSENTQAGELVKFYSLSFASRSALVGWDGKMTKEPFQLIKPDGTPKIALWTLSKLSKTLSEVKNIGKITPGDEDYGARFYDRSNDGLWIAKFGIGLQSVAIGWVDSEKPPMFTAGDYDLPFTSTLELEYLVPDRIENGKPVFKKLTLAGKNGSFTLPTDRLDPFILKPTGEPIEAFAVVLNPPELNLDPGQSGTVKVSVTGCDGKVTLTVPSTRTLPIEVTPVEPGDFSMATLKVLTDSSNKGKSITVKITASCENGSQASADLVVNVSQQTTTNILLWVGKTTALVNGKETKLAVPPTIVSGKTLVPVRFISEAFGAKVEWDAKEQRIDLIFGLLEDGSYTKKVTLWVGKKTARSDFGSKLPAYREYTLDVAPTIISGTTMVPIRFISDVLGAKTTWDNNEKRIDIVWTQF